MRIAWLGHRSPQLGGGMATYSTETVAGLRKRGHHVTFFHHGLGGESTGPVEDSISLKSTPLVKPLVLQGRRAQRTLVERLERGDFDLVHASFWFSSLDFNLPKTCHRLGIPIVATFHVAFDRRLSLWGGITNATYRIYAPALSECDRVIVFGAAQRDTLAALGVPEESLVVLPNGVDVDKYKPGESDWKSRLQAETLFVYSGRIDSEKNVDELIQAYLAAQPPDACRLTIMGNGTERKRLQRQYRDPRVLFLGHVADEAQRIGILRAADGFFLPSSVEGLSLSMLEAMACGAPMVATDVGGDGEALRGAGIVIDPASLREQLELAFRELLEMPWLRPELGRRARERALERFSLKTNLDRLIELYEELRR